MGHPSKYLHQRAAGGIPKGAAINYKDARESHAANWPKFRAAAEDLRRDRGFGPPPPLPPRRAPNRGKPMPMDLAARGLARTSAKGEEP